MLQSSLVYQLALGILGSARVVFQLSWNVALSSHPCPQVELRVSLLTS